ncbi:MAG: oxygenase MpaB family protein [Nannocystaceae bacterium]|nr:DUF2236 domain-containing protein [bacterium]
MHALAIERDSGDAAGSTAANLRDSDRTSPWPARHAAPVSSAADPLAEGAVEAVPRGEGSPMADGHGDLLAAVEALAERGDEPCRAFLAHALEHPSWVDTARLEEGQRLGLALAVPTGAVLLLGGLVEVYGVAPIADALGSTRRLHDQTWRRILETGRLVRDVHLRGAMAPGADGLRAIVRVRLLHAMIRVRLAHRGHDVITQEQMAFTLCAHSHVVRRCLSRLGIRLTAREARAHQHLWRLIGHAMGVRPEFLPDSPEQETRLYRRLRLELCTGAAGAGRVLTARTIETVARRSRLPRALVSTLVHHLVGAQLADRLAVRRTTSYAALLSVGSALLGGANRMRRASSRLDALCMRGGRGFANVVLETDPGRGDPIAAAAARGALAMLSDARRRGLDPCTAR